jgi:hypothetical protein
VTAFAGRVNVAFTDDLWTWDPTWVAIDQIHDSLVTSYSIDRGRSYEVDRTDSGKATVQLTDPLGLLDPTNPSSPYLGRINPLVQVQLCRWDPMQEEWQPRFRGWISAINYTFDPSQVTNTLTLELVGIQELLGAIDMRLGEFGDPPPSGSTTPTIFFENGPMNARIIQVLGNAHVPADYYVVFSGNVELTQSIYTPNSESPLTVVQEAADAEWSGVANVYEDRWGRLSVHGRYGRFDPAAVLASPGGDRWDFHEWEVGDLTHVESDPGAIAQLREFSFARDVSKIINHATAYPQWILDGSVYRAPKAAEIAGQTVQDTVSIGQYGIRSWSAENLQTQSGLVDGSTGLVETKRVASYYVDNYAQPRNRITTIGFRSILPGRVGSEITWKLLSRVDISDKIQVTVQSPGGGGFSEQDYYVEGVHETAAKLNGDYDDVTVRLDLSPAALFPPYGDPGNPFPDPA